MKREELEKERRPYLPTVPISSGQSRFAETETWRPARRSKKADSSRLVPINAQKHDFKPAFCLFSLFFGRNSSFFCVFWPFLMYPSVVGSYPNKKSVLYQGIVLVKSSFSCHFPLNARNFVNILGLFFSCSKWVESLTKTFLCLFDSLDSWSFKIFRGSMPPDPLENRGLRPRIMIASRS